MELAIVNDYAQAELFFKEFNIPYETVAKGRNKGKLRVKPLRGVDRNNVLDVISRLRDAGLGDIVDHSNCFRDADDNTVCTFSPYNIIEIPKKTSWLVMSDYSIYGMSTKTYVVVVKE